MTKCNRYSRQSGIVATVLGLQERLAAKRRSVAVYNLGDRDGPQFDSHFPTRVHHHIRARALRRRRYKDVEDEGAWEAHASPARLQPRLDVVTRETIISGVVEDDDRQRLVLLLRITARRTSCIGAALACTSWEISMQAPCSGYSTPAASGAVGGAETASQGGSW